MFYVIDVTDGCPSSFKAEVYSADKFTLEQVLTIFTNYCEQVNEETGELITEENDFCYTLNTFATMGRVEKYTEGYYYEM